MPRWKLIISGRVQTAGYRAMVKNIALGLQIKGVVRNLDDGTVEIFCEASAESFESFKEAINIKSEPKNIFAPSVSEIMVYDTSSPDYGTPPDEDFKAFKIDYSGVDPEIETLERSEMGIIALGAVNQNIVAMHSDLKAEAIKTHDKLDHIADVTLKSHEKLDNIADATTTTHEKLDSIDNRLGDVIDRYGEFGEKMTHLEHNIGDLTYQIKRLVEHVVGKEETDNE